MRLKDGFERASELSIYWYNCSQDLIGAAASVWFASDPDIEPKVIERAGLREGFSLGAATPLGYRMLCGLATELIFKAILVARREKVPMHHDLSKLAQLAKVDYTKKEDGLLAILTAAIKWHGRYPIPKTRAEWEELLKLDEEHLWEPGGAIEHEGVKLRFRQPTGALKWDGFARLYAKAMKVYFEARDQEPDES